jgi:hypothetical protein
MNHSMLLTVLTSADVAGSTTSLSTLMCPSPPGDPMGVGRPAQQPPHSTHSQHARPQRMLQPPAATCARHTLFRDAPTPLRLYTKPSVLHTMRSSPHQVQPALTQTRVGCARFTQPLSC